MIKLFRNVRQRLLRENRFSRYLIYAIGEIILVVIGILIALGINTWNTERQVKATNKKYLKNMVEDLSMTKERLNRVVYVGDRDNSWPSMVSAIKDCDSLLALSYVGFEEKDLDYFLNSMPNSGNSLLNVYDNTYTEMLNTGKLYQLESETLTKQITRYYKICERENFYNEKNSETANEGLSRIMDGLGKMRMDHEESPKHFNLKDYPSFAEKTSKDYQDFQTGIKMMQTAQQNNMNKMILIMSLTDSLQTAIKKELQSYN
ncbi:MAG: DUF6090 family protein [Gelidibacter sp.]